MKRLLDDAHKGQHFEDSRGAIWEYCGRYGPDDEFLFPHVLKCLDTEQTDDFSPDGWDEYARERCRYPLRWAVIAP